MEKLYRFELAFDGIPQGVGFLTGLDDVGLSYDEADIILDPFFDLPHPPPYQGVVYWFTQKGLKSFAHAINIAIEMVALKGWQLQAGVIEADVAANAVFADDYQAAFPRDSLPMDSIDFVEVLRAEDALELERSICLC